MRNLYFIKRENLSKLQSEKNNGKNISYNSLKRINVNKNQNHHNYAIKHFNTEFFINKKNKVKDIINLKSNELTNILGKINQEFYKEKKYYTNISNYFHRDYLNLKGNSISKSNASSSKNLSRNYSQCSYVNKPESYINDRKKKLTIFVNNNISHKNILGPNLLKARINPPLTDNFIRPVYQIQSVNRQNYNKNKISNFILKHSNKQLFVNTEIDNENENIIDNDYDKNNKIIQVKKLHKSLKKNKSQNKFKTNITPMYNNNLSEKNNKKNEVLSNPKVLHNMGNFYNFWKDNDGHTGGKINLALNNLYRNKINFYDYLYYIIKIQSVWKGHILRKSLLQKNAKNSKLNIFYKQKTFLTLLFNILKKKFKKNYFQLFKERINEVKKINNKQGYDINSSLLNHISDCYQKYYKNKNGQNLLLYNKKRLNQKKNNLKYNKNITKSMNTPQITRQNTDLRFYKNNNKNNQDNKDIKDIKNTIDFTNYKDYKPLKTNELSYKGYKKKNEDKNEKDDRIEKIKLLNNQNGSKKYIFILPDEVNHFSINNNNMNNNNINKDNNKNKQSANNNIINEKKNPITNVTKNDNNNNNNKINKYREYIYFLFLLFAKIQKASHKLIFKELINSLNERKNDNLKKIKKNKLLKIIKNIERKKMLYYFKIFKEKVLTEKIKDILLNKKNNNNLYPIKKNENKNLTHSEKKIFSNKFNSNNSNNLNRQHSSKKHIRIKKLNRSISVHQSLKKKISNIFNNYSDRALSKSSSISPKKMIIKQRTNIIKPINKSEYYELTHEYLLKRKVKRIFDKLDKKEIKIFFKRWKILKNARKKKKFLIYFIMLMKECFCNDKSLKYNKEYTLGKFMFFWYRKTFY